MIDLLSYILITFSAVGLIGLFTVFIFSGGSKND